MALHPHEEQTCICVCVCALLRIHTHTCVYVCASENRCVGVEGLHTTIYNGMPLWDSDRAQVITHRMRGKPQGLVRPLQDTQASCTPVSTAVTWSLLHGALPGFFSRVLISHGCLGVAWTHRTRSNPCMFLSSWSWNGHMLEGWEGL